MVSQSQRLREARQRALIERSRRVQRQRDIQSQQRALRGLEPVRKPVAPAPPSPEQLRAEEYKKEYAKTISKLETNRSKYEKQLTNLKKEYDAKVTALSKAGKLTSAVMVGINKDYLARRRPLLSRVQGYNEAIQLAKTRGVSDLRQLSSYASQVADVSEQQRAVAYRIGEIGERKEEVVETTTAYRDPETGQLMSMAPSIAKESGYEAVKVYTRTGIPVPTAEKKRIEQSIVTYQQQGFSKSESTYLAEEGAKQQMSFTPKYAGELLEQRRIESLFSPIVTAPKTKFEEAIIEKRVEVPTEFKDVQIAQDFMGTGGIAIGGVGGVVRGEPFIDIMGTTGRIVSPYPTGAKATAFWYPLTQEQLEAQAEAQQKGSFQEFPPIKFLGGEYPWQKKLAEMGKEAEPTKLDIFLGYEGYKGKEEQDLFGGEYSFKELAKKGAYPEIIRKGFAESLGGLSVWGAEKITGGELPPKIKQRTKEQIGTIGLFFGFAPLMKTGTYSQHLQQEATSEWIYDYVKRKWVKRSKLTGEITRTEATSSFGEMSEARQLSILRRAFRTSGKYKRVYLDKPSLLKDVEKAKQFMRESGLNEYQIQSRIDKLFPQLKKVEVPIVEQEGFVLPKPKVQKQIQVQKPIVKEISIELPRQIPIGQIGGVTTLDASKVRQVMWTKQKTRQDLLSKSILGLDYSQRQKTISALSSLTTTIPKLDTLTKTVPKLDTLTKTTPTFPTFPTYPPEVIEEPTPKITKIWLPKIKRKTRKLIEEEKRKPHELLIKSKGKWRKVGKPFPSKQRAEDVGAFFTDTSLPATFKVKPSKKKPTKKEQFSIPSNYFTREGFGKFRTYQVRKGKKVPLKNTYIEFQNRRLDTRGEVQKIHLEKALAENRKRLIKKQQINTNLNKMFFPQFRQKSNLNLI